MNKDKALAALNGHKGGVPRKFTKSLANEICKAVSTSPLTLKALCSQNPHWPSYEVIRLSAERYDWFDSMMQRARARQAGVLLEDNEQRSVDLLAAPGDMARVQAHRIVFENRRWWAGKVDRGQWGDDSQVNIANVQGVVVSDEQLRDLRKRLVRIRSKAALEAEHGSQGAQKSPPQVP
jgi:hypothetical protein